MTCTILFHDIYDQLINCHNFLHLFSKIRMYTNLEGCFDLPSYTLSIGNLTPRFGLSFYGHIFLNKESYMIFFLILFFFLKTKINGDFKSFFKKIKIFTNKKWISLLSGNTCEKCGSTLLFIYLVSYFTICRMNPRIIILFENYYSKLTSFNKLKP